MTSPFLGFASDKVSVLGRRHRHRRGSKICEDAREVRIDESGVDRSIECVDDSGGVFLGRPEPCQPLRLELGKNSPRRHVGSACDSHCGRYRARAACRP